MKKEGGMNSMFLLRIRLLGGLCICVALFIILRLYFVQIIHGAEYRSDAMGQYVEDSVTQGDRGTIYMTDRTGELVAAAVMQTGWRVAITPKDIVQATSTYLALKTIIPIDSERFFSSAAKKSDPYEEVAFNIDDTSADQIRALKLPGVILVQDEWRMYPGHDLASQVIGFVGFKGSEKVGVYGLEKEWQDTLAITSNGREMNPFAELFANAEALLAPDPASHSGSIITSIEPTVEQQLQDTLDTVMTMYTPKSAGGIIMDTQTGDIIAMSSRPSFDPNTYNTVTDLNLFSDPLVEGRYEMGSIMKPLTMAAGIDTGSVTTATTYNDTGCIMRTGKKICNYDGKARGVIPMQEILNQSLNVGATFVEEQTGHEQFAAYMKKYGLGERTGIDLPDEVQSDIHSLDSGGSDVDFASASFGQGIAVSPIQMIRALDVLANHGLIVFPHVVTGIKYENGITRQIAPKTAVQVIKPETAATVTDMLITVVDKALLKGTIKEDHYTVAAKTGTAQIADPNGKGYYTDRYLHSFFGYFPAHNPRFIIFLFTVEPHGQEYASATLAHPFNDLEKFLINYYQLPPDR